MIEFQCSCGQELRVPESLSDQQGACPQCGEPVRVPIAGIQGWSGLIVDAMKEPVLAWPLMSDHPDVQARTWLPGQLNFVAWASVWIAIAQMMRHNSPWLAALGWDGTSAPTVVIELLAAALVLNVVTVQLCWAAAGNVYFRFTGRRHDGDRPGFAAAGGYDIARWIPLLTLLAMAVAYRTTWMGEPAVSLPGFRRPWVFVCLVAITAPGLSWLAAQVLFGVRFGRAAAVEGLLRALKDQEANVRWDAARTLARYGDHRAVRPLTGALQDPNDNVRWAAASALGRLSDRRGRAALERALGDRKESVAREAERALRRIAARSAARPPVNLPEKVRWEKVKIFISSTFQDMHAERDFLVKHVLPQLREWCARRRLLLIEVDLRWGVTERDAIHHRNVVRVCLDRIDECDPFFICFLGQRRGWVPGPTDVSPETLERFPGLHRYLGRASVTELEIIHVVVESLNARRSSTSPDARRPGVFFYLRDPAAVQAIPTDPAQLRQIYCGEGPNETLARWRDETLPQTGCPIRVYRANWDPASRTPELALPYECPSSDLPGLERWRAQWSAAGIEVEGRSVPRGSIAAAHAYNERLCAGRFSGFMIDQTPLAEVVLRDLQQAITARYPNRAESPPASDLHRELDQQAYCLALNTEGFVERPEGFRLLDAHAQSADQAILALTGAGGLGKSMLLANWIDRRGQESREHETLWLFRFLGASDGSSDVDSLLRYLLLELRERGALDGDIPDDPARLHAAFREGLARAARAFDIVLVLDGLDRLESRFEVLDWLAIPPPEGVRVIVGFRSDEPDAQRLLQRWRQDPYVRVSELGPVGDAGDRRRMVRAYLSQYLKELDDQEEEMLVSAEGAENPLYLRVVLSELRVFGSFANLRAYLRVALGTTPLEAFDGVLRRMEHDVAYTPLEPQHLVPLVFGHLSHARRGLRADELIDLVVAHYPWPANVAEPPRRASAAEAVHFCLRQVRPFLTESSNRIEYFYSDFRAACLRRYGEASAGPPSPVWHHRLIEYFSQQPLFVPSHGGSTFPNARKLEELPWQLARAGQWSELEAVLTDLTFLDAKCRAGMIQDVARDFDRVPLDQTSDRLRLFRQFVLQHRQILARDGTLLLPFAHNYASSGPVVEEAARCLAERGWDPPWVKLRDRPPLLDRPALLRTMEGHAGEVTGVALSADRRILLSGDGSGGLRIWDPSSGQLVREVCEHGYGAIRKLAMTPDGRLGATAHADGAVRVWHIDGGTCLHTLTGHRGEATAVAITADGRFVVSGGEDATIRLWNLERLQLERMLRGHFGAVYDLALTSSGAQLVSAGWDCTLRIWDLGSGACVRRIEAHRVSVRGVAVADRLARIASCSGPLAGPTGTAPAGLADSDVRFWSADGARQWTGKGHSIAARGGRRLGVLASAVRSIALDCEGVVALSGGDDRTVCVWDVVGRRLTRRFHGHTASVLATALAPERMIGVTGGADGTVRMWDLSGSSPEPSGGCRRVERVGRGRDVDSETLAAAMWRNQRLRRWVLTPLAAIVLGAVAVFPGWRLLEANGAPNDLGRLAWSVLLTWLLLGFLSWRQQLQDAHVPTSPALRPLRRMAGSVLRLLTPLFPVSQCPCCGHAVSGRRRFFHCGVCGWHDPVRS